MSVVLPCPVSRKWAARVTVEDLGSANGTLINDATIVNVDNDVTVVAAPDLPGSWVDGLEGANHTRAFAVADILRQDEGGSQLERNSDLAHLILLNENGATLELLELQITLGDESGVWEIGRDESCEIVLSEVSEVSVSGRHAQLSHRAGRWKMVNLVSKNGIFINGKKRLSAYLSDGDEVRLGRVNMVFRVPVLSPSPIRPVSSTVARFQKVESRARLYLIVAGLVALAIMGVLML